MYTLIILTTVFATLVIGDVLCGGDGGNININMCCDKDDSCDLKRVCNDDEIFVKCTHDAPLTCKDQKPHKIENRCVRGCYCKPGLVRDVQTWKCVKPSQCPDTNICRKDEVFVDCRHDLPTRCRDRRIRIVKECVTGCFCKPGLIRNAITWQCVLPNSCPPVPASGPDPDSES